MTTGTICDDVIAGLSQRKGHVFLLINQSSLYKPHLTILSPPSCCKSNGVFNIPSVFLRPNNNRMEFSIYRLPFCVEITMGFTISRLPLRPENDVLNIPSAFLRPNTKHR